MAVVASDILLKYSVAAAAGDTTAGTGPTSLGDQISTTQAVTAALWDDVSSAEASAGDTEYRCIFVHNNHATDSALNVQVSVQAEVALGASITIALDNIGVTAKGAATAQALAIANESTAPSGGAGITAFGAGPLTIGTIPAGSCAGVWIKRTVSASTAALTGDGFTLRVSFDG
jgi:hypothetical protein